jgi:hypothetical protein
VATQQIGGGQEGEHPVPHEAPLEGAALVGPSQIGRASTFLSKLCNLLSV